MKKVVCFLIWYKWHFEDIKEVSKFFFLFFEEFFNFHKWGYILLQDFWNRSMILMSRVFLITDIYFLSLYYFNTLTATRVFKEMSARPRVQQYQTFSARCSHWYFSNASRSCGGLKNDLSFHLFATLKPLAVIEYNEGKCGIDYSDQMVFYVTTIRKGIKWYRKLGIQLLLEISVVNALTVYKIATRKNINIRIFSQLLVAKLLGLSENIKNPCLRRSRHNIAVWKNDSGRSIRCACKLCYANKRLRMDRTKAQKNLKKTTTYCPNCLDQPQLCIECFKVLRSK